MFCFKDFDLPIYEEFLGDDNESQNNAKESGDDDDPIALFDEDEDETGRTAGNSQNLKATDKIWPIFQGH
jgi:hypothetical protein